MRFPLRVSSGTSGYTTGPLPGAEVAVRRLGAVSLAWRLVVLVIGVVLVARGTLVGQEGDWPFGPMSQFAFRTGPNDAIHSTFLQARNTADQVIVIPISRGQVGIARAEIEGQLPDIVREPSLLGGLADAYRRLHPDEPALEQLWLRDRVTDLYKGRAVGEHVDLIVGWPVDDG